MSWDGRLHTLDVATGKDIAPPEKFIAPNGKPYALNLFNGVDLYVHSAGMRRKYQRVPFVMTSRRRKPAFSRRPAAACGDAAVWPSIPTVASSWALAMRRSSPRPIASAPQLSRSSWTPTSNCSLSTTSHLPTPTGCSGATSI